MVALLVVRATVVMLALARRVPPVKLIIDTDIGGGGCNDVDDVVAVCIGHALEQRGDTELLAIVQNTAPIECMGAISVLNTWYRREALPIGAYNIRTPGATLVMEDPVRAVASQRCEARQFLLC
jgi:hypothetical protein